MIDEKALKEYAGLKMIAKNAETRLKELYPIVKDAFNESDKGTEIKIDGIGFLRPKFLKKWAYSSEVTKLDDSLKAAKKHEQATGVATFEENVSVEFREK